MGVYFTIQITNRDEMTLTLTQKAWLLWLEHQQIQSFLPMFVGLC